MDWRPKGELFEQIRREYEFGIGTIQGVPRKFGVHRRMVREALAKVSTRWAGYSSFFPAMSSAMVRICSGELTTPNPS